MNQGKFRRICMESSMWITSIWALKCFQKMHSLTNYYQLDGERNVIYSYSWLLRVYFLFCQNYWEVNITCCLNDSSSRSLSEANLWLSRRTSRSASSPCKVIVCVMFRSNSKFVLINKTYRPREWSILHWLYVDAVKAESVNILKTLDTYSISTISRDETLISRNETFAPRPRGDYSGGLMVDPGEGPGGLDPPPPPPPPPPPHTHTHTHTHTHPHQEL